MQDSRSGSHGGRCRITALRHARFYPFLLKNKLEWRKVLMCRRRIPPIPILLDSKARHWSHRCMRSDAVLSGNLQGRRVGLLPHDMEPLGRGPSSADPDPFKPPPHSPRLCSLQLALSRTGNLVCKQCGNLALHKKLTQSFCFLSFEL
ncbi:hypothetical protein GUJ93_ZPchr0005g14844 [Zizania palustris]|uniref:Uncharacterized protein n=1 Tax=Zizania palustris TaxID=103762 RepID=A0A8J5W1M6_ZIZPA|nr:hypothetical protein GUJ93_ZPchr0005g14844 [Zizania palustris]